MDNHEDGKMNQMILTLTLTHLHKEFGIPTLVVCARVRHLLVAEIPYNIESLQVVGEK